MSLPLTGPDAPSPIDFEFGRVDRNPEPARIVDGQHHDRRSSVDDEMDQLFVVDPGVGVEMAVGLALEHGFLAVARLHGVG